MLAKIALLTTDLTTAQASVTKLAVLVAAQTAKIEALGGDIATLKDASDAQVLTIAQRDATITDLRAQIAGTPTSTLSAEDDAALDANHATATAINQTAVDAVAANSLS